MNTFLTLIFSILILGTQSARASAADVKQIVESKLQPLIGHGQRKEKRYQSVLVAVFKDICK